VDRVGRHRSRRSIVTVSTRNPAMNARALLSTLGTIAVAAVAAPAAAQNACPPGARAVATYDVAVNSFASPAKLVLADSAGKLVASFYFAGEEHARPMRVDVRGSDLVVRGESPKGTMEFVLYGQNEHVAGGRFRGRWTVGQEQGALRGTMRS
jgi:hypothetical protein